MIDVGIDFETYYDDDYSLKKMENAEYVMDPRFEIIGCAVKQKGQPTQWISGDPTVVSHELRKLDWANIRVVAHNARFEASILEWRLGIKPAAYMCTMAGSRPHIVPYAGGQSLAQIAEYLKLGQKGSAVEGMKGKHRVDMSQVDLKAYANYCVNDVELSLGIADHLSTILPIDEQKVIDATLKKYVRTELTLDRTILADRLEQVKIDKAEMLERIETRHGIELEGLRSRQKFAARLEVELIKSNERVPLKKNKGGQDTFAFAKDDPDMKRLLVHPNQAVRELCAAKLATSSSLEESRLQRLIELHDLMGGKLPVPLVYYGAHTGRLSGDEKINLQNLPRVVYSKDKTKLLKGHLRFAIRARPGYSIVAADLSNIEARIVATLAGQHDLVEAFRLGQDIYSKFASLIYGYEVHKNTHPIERFVGKTCILGLGYGMGWKKFHLKMIQEGVDMDAEAARRAVQLYRETYEKIPRLWGDMDRLARIHMTNPTALYPWKYGITFAAERIILPNDMPIIYPGITQIVSGLGFKSRYGRGLIPTVDKFDHAGTGHGGIGNLNVIWGGAFTENLAQALARIILTRAELALAAMNLPTVLQVHDELVFHVPTSVVPQVKTAVESVLTRMVPWMPELPVACEINHGPSYGDAK